MDRDDDGGDDEEESSTDCINILPRRRYKEITDHGLGDSIIILPELKAVICTECNYTVTPSWLIRHFNDQRHRRSFNKASVEKKMAELDIPMGYEPKPPPAGCLVPTGLKAVQFWKCGACQELFNPQTSSWQRHPCPQKSKITTTAAHWKKAIPFEVVTEVSDSDAHMTVERWAEEKLLELEEGKEDLIINPTTPASQIHPFLIRSGWIEFFRPLEMAQLETLKEYTTLPSPKDPIRVLLQRVFDELQDTINTPSNRGLQSHFFTPTGYVA